MTTSSQIAANQSNAQRSTGPKTPEGKAVSCRNRFKHGCTGAFTVLPWESQDEFDMLIGSLRDEHKPCGVTEMILVDKMAQALWLSKRAQMLQHVTFNHEVPVCDDPKQLALYLRYQTTNERAFHKCLNDLLKLRAEKRRQEIGFESQERKRSEEARKEADHIRREAAEKRKQDMHRIHVLLAEAKVDHQLLQTIMLRMEQTATECEKEDQEEEKQHSISAQKAA
jgi:hypothetical protein